MDWWAWLLIGMASAYALLGVIFVIDCAMVAFWFWKSPDKKEQKL